MIIVRGGIKKWPTNRHSHFAKDGDLQAWGKVADALKWATTKISTEISPITETVYFNKPE